LAADFRSVRHQSLMQKMAALEIPDHIYNWMAKYFAVPRSHDQVTGHHLVNSNNKCKYYPGDGHWSSIIASDLHPRSTLNCMMKYADDRPVARILFWPRQNVRERQRRPAPHD